MPLDTRDKRASAIMVGLPFGRILPHRNGDINEADRQQLGYLYSGVAAELPMTSQIPVLSSVMTFAVVTSKRLSFPLVVSEPLTFASVLSASKRFNQRHRKRMYF